MSETMQWLLGLKKAPDWVAGGSWSLQFQSAPTGIWAVVYAALALGVIAAIWYLYKSELSSVGRPLRLLLVGLRLVVLVLVSFMLMELMLVITKREDIPSRLIVMVDTTASMNLSDPYPRDEQSDQLASKLGLEGSAGLRKGSRLQISQKVLPKVLDELADGRELSIYTFAHQAVPTTAEGLASAEAKGTETAIGDALSTALAEHRGQPLAGILLITDGQSNAGEDPRKVAAQAGKAAVPIVSYAVGTEQGPGNARLAGIDADPYVFVRDPAEVAVVVEAHGMSGRTGFVALEKRQNDNWVEVGREEITFNEDSAARRLSFHITPEALGEIEFRARVSDLGDELSETDNFATHLMKVVRQQIRVLLIAGSPSPEVQFLRNTLMRDTGIEFACWLQTAGDRYEQMGTRPLRRLPSTREELEQFDAIILFDPDMQALGPAWSDLLSQFVGSAGGGVIYVAGEMNTRSLFEGSVTEGPASGKAIENSWLRILPVAMDSAGLRGNDVSLSSTEPFNLELTPEGAGDSIFQFAADPTRNREILSSLPGMYWHFPVTRPKPGAMVLARHGDPRMRNAFGRNVLMATQRYGPGRTVFLSFDATYRWRYLHEEYFDGFWARVIDRVGRSKALGGRYPFQLSTDKIIYQIGDRVTIRATDSEANERTSSVTDLKGELEMAGGAATALEMELLPDQPGVAQAAFTASESGVYTVRMLPGNVVNQGDAGVRPALLEFKVEPAHSELDRPKLDRALLDDMAKASGGAVIAVTDFELIPDEFKIKQVGRTLEFHDELWDAPLIFGLLMVCLTLEWLLRKRARMA